MSNITEIDDALSAALHALSAAQATLRKSLPGRAIDVLQKAEPRDAYEPARRALGISAADTALAALADAERRITALESASVAEASAKARAAATRVTGR
jgi:hypothetical protein